MSPSKGHKLTYMLPGPEKQDFGGWIPILQAAATPARSPRFQELSANGEWNDWSAEPVLPEEEPTLVKQPQWTQILTYNKERARGELGRFEKRSNVTHLLTHNLSFVPRRPSSHPS